MILIIYVFQRFTFVLLVISIYFYMIIVLDLKRQFEFENFFTFLIHFKHDLIIIQNRHVPIIILQ